MWREILVSTALVILTVLIHSIGMLYLARVLRLERLRDHELSHHGLRSKIAHSLTLVLGLMAIHGAEIWLYALTFLELGAVEGLRQSVYFSTISYAAIGYSDVAIDPDWVLIGAIEGINGLILLGWSTAFFVQVMTRLRR